MNNWQSFIFSNTRAELIKEGFSSNMATRGADYAVLKYNTSASMPGGAAKHCLTEAKKHVKSLCKRGKK